MSSKERGIIFNTEMVRAILEDRKTVTRRPVKPPRGYEMDQFNSFNPNLKAILWDGDGFPGSTGCRDKYQYCPFDQIGDMLYVRETWLQKGCWRHGKWLGCEEVAYSADGWPKQEIGEVKYRKRPSIHMPKWAARIWLEITDIRVERIQDITEEQSIKEGFQGGSIDCGDHQNIWSASDSFMETWHSIYSHWDENPWVWVIEFIRVEK